MSNLESRDPDSKLLQPSKLWMSKNYTNTSGTIRKGYSLESDHHLAVENR